MTDPQVFLPHEYAKSIAEQVVPNLSAAAKGDLLLYFAYRKRIREAPYHVLENAVKRLESATLYWVGIVYDTPELCEQVMYQVDRLLWPKDERESRKWLLRVE